MLAFWHDIVLLLCFNGFAGAGCQQQVHFKEVSRTGSAVH
jgi:hypothetical protein